MGAAVAWKDNEPYCSKCDVKLQGEKGFWYKYCHACGARTYYNPWTPDAIAEEEAKIEARAAALEN